MNTLEFLDAIKAKHNISSDYALAKLLQIPQSTMSSYRMGRRIIDDDMCLTVAQALGIHPFQVIASANAERAKTPEQRARWSGFMDNLSASFKTLLLGYGPRQCSF